MDNPDVEICEVNNGANRVLSYAKIFGLRNANGRLFYRIKHKIIKRTGNKEEKNIYVASRAEINYSPACRGCSPFQWSRDGPWRQHF